MQKEEVTTIVKDPSASGSSAQGAAANAPPSGEAAPKNSSAQAAGPTAGSTPATQENIDKSHELDDY